MRSVHSLVFALGVVGQALATPHLATREEVLAQAAHDASQYCASPLRCKYSISGVEEGWSVIVMQVSRDSDGKEGYPVGGYRVYIYSIEGRLLREIAGL